GCPRRIRYGGLAPSAKSLRLSTSSLPPAFRSRDRLRRSDRCESASSITPVCKRKLAGIRSGPSKGGPDDLYASADDRGGRRVFFHRSTCSTSGEPRRTVEPSVCACESAHVHDGGVHEGGAGQRE